MRKLYKPFYDEEITPWNKKYSVYILGRRGPKLIHFGAAGMEQYEDKISKRYSAYDHKDNYRRSLYRKRHAKTKHDDKNSPAYYSWHYLW
jgi:hypothetical protein